MKLLSRAEEIMLIAIWKLDDQAYGVTIRDLLRDLTGEEWTFGAIYAPLDKLTRKKFVRKYSSDPVASRGGRRKMMYELTGEGKTALKEIREVQNSLWSGIGKYALD